MHPAALDAMISAADRARWLADERCRPSMVRAPRIFLDGDHWCALLGDDIMIGVVGFGASPELACVAFDKAWTAHAQCVPAPATQNSDGAKP